MVLARGCSVEPIFGSEHGSPPSSERTPRRPSCLKTPTSKRNLSYGSSAAVTSDEEAGFVTPVLDSTPRTMRKSMSWSDRLEVVHPIFETTYKSRTWMQRNVCTLSWTVVLSGFALLLIFVTLFTDELAP